MPRRCCAHGYGSRTNRSRHRPACGTASGSPGPHRRPPWSHCPGGGRTRSRSWWRRRWPRWRWGCGGWCAPGPSPYSRPGPHRTVKITVYNSEQACRTGRSLECALRLAKDPRAQYAARGNAAGRVWHGDGLAARCVVTDGRMVRDEAGITSTRWYLVTSGLGVQGLAAGGADARTPGRCRSVLRGDVGGRRVGARCARLGAGRFGSSSRCVRRGSSPPVRRGAALHEGGDPLLRVRRRHIDLLGGGLGGEGRGAVGVERGVDQLFGQGQCAGRSGRQPLRPLPGRLRQLAVRDDPVDQAQPLRLGGRYARRRRTSAPWRAAGRSAAAGGRRRRRPGPGRGVRTPR